MTSEPVRVAVTGLVTASLAVLVAFGVEFTTEQTAAIVGLVAAAFAVGEIVRSRVTPSPVERDGEAGYGLIEVAFALLLVVVAVILLAKYL